MSKSRRRPLADPSEWCEPTFRQAWADFRVASLLCEFEMDGPPYKGERPIDAALDKFQQSLEKLLKAAILDLAPEMSKLSFTHRLLTNPEVNPMFLKLFQMTAALSGGRSGKGQIPRTLRMLESLLPDPEAAILDERNRVIGLPINSQYAFTKRDAKGALEVVAPCDRLPVTHGLHALEIQKDLDTLFRSIRTTARKEYASLRAIAERSGVS